MPKLMNLKGKRYGKLVVLERAPNGSGGMTRWMCLCDCGNKKEVMAKHLKSGAISDCGCERSKRMTQRNLKHGDSGTKLYNTWCHMRSRCNNPNGIDYPDYGGRGIRVCDEWENSYEAFREWALKSGYQETKKISIDRINVNGDYEPENCRWVDDYTQANNKRDNHYIEYHGERMTLAEAVRKSKTVRYDTAKARIYKGWNPEEAIDTPLTTRRNKHGNRKNQNSDR